jgi:GT2 family glycosyltransferase
MVPAVLENEHTVLDGSLANRGATGVVAIGRNEGARLVDCLASIRPVAETIVYVDSGSTDGSIVAARRLGVSVVPLDMEQAFTAARARNEGFAHLKGINKNIKFVQFIDGDCTLTPDWLPTALTFLAETQDVGLVCGRRRERHPEASAYNKLCDIEWNTPVGESSSCGGDFLVRAEAFEKSGGFTAQLIAGEEPEFCVRLRESGWKIWRLDADMSWHDANITHFAQWWARAVRGGYGYAQGSWHRRRSPSGLWRKEIVRAILWGGLIPLAISLAGLIHPAFLAGILIYPLQTTRIALRKGPLFRESWIYAFFITLAKFAELQGLLRFHLRWRSDPMEYKQLGRIQIADPSTRCNGVQSSQMPR